MADDPTQAHLESANAFWEQASEGIVLADERGLAIDVNPRAAEIFGARDAVEILGRSLTDFIDPGDLARNPLKIDVLLEGGVVRSERRVLRLDGQTITVEVSAKRLSDGRLQAIFHDISERVAAQRALQRSEERYRQISELASDYSLALRIESDGTMVREWVTDAFELITGFSADEVDAHGRILSLTPDQLEARGGDNLVHPADLGGLLRRYRAAASGPWTRIQEEFRILTRSGDERWVRQTSKLVRDAAASRIYAATEDITFEHSVRAERERITRDLEWAVAARTKELEAANQQLQALQQSLLHARELEAAGQLAGQVAHAIHNPLTALIGNAEMLGESGQPDPQRVGQVLKLALRIRDVVDHTLELVRRGKLSLTLERPGAILDDVREELRGQAERAGISIHVDVSEQTPSLRVDRALLSEALALIGQNAIQAMDRGGRLDLQVEPVAGLAVVAFRVLDTGPGIPEELRERILQPFFTTKPRGNGLGLAIAHGVIRGHEGRLTIESRPGGGTAMSVELPREDGARSLTAP